MFTTIIVDLEAFGYILVTLLVTLHYTTLHYTTLYYITTLHYHA
jgi:hypothetical protein